MANYLSRPVASLEWVDGTKGSGEDKEKCSKTKSTSLIN